MHNRSIRHQVLVLALAPTLIIAILLAFYFTSARIEDLEESVRKRGETIALKLVPLVEYGVFSNNRAWLQNFAQTSLEDSGVQAISFYNEKGELLAETGKVTLPFRRPSENSSSNHGLFTEENPQSMSFIVPITNFSETADESDTSQTEKLNGWLKVEVDTTPIRLEENEVLIHTTFILLLGLSISGLYALKLGKNVTRPILELTQSIERIKVGELNTRINLTSYRELDILASGINTMTESLENAQAELQHKVNKATMSLRRSLETIEVQNLELEVARQRAVQANQIKSQFLANMSHEIRTPLNGLMGFANLLAKSKLDGTQREYLNTVQKSARTLLSLINDILDFSKIEAGKLQIESLPMNLHTCIKETLQLFTPFAFEKSLNLLHWIAPDVPEHIMGDFLRIQQILSNFVSNAIKFTTAGSVVVHAQVLTQEVETLTLKISVKDSGIGLSHEEQQQLFQAFTQVKQLTPVKAKGSGLGLSICKNLVEHMGGEIGIESAPNQGSTFWFSFKAANFNLSERDDSRSPLDDSFFEGSTEPSTSVGFLAEKQGYLKKTCLDWDKQLPPLRILAIDDNPDNLKLLNLLLLAFKMDVVTANSGEAGLFLFQSSGPFDIVFMDIRMPNLDGTETTRLMRSFEQHKGLKPTPIIALTAHALISEQEGLREAGFNDYLSKPIDELALKTLLHKWSIPQKPEGPPSSPSPSPSLPLIDWSLAQKNAGGNLQLAEDLFQKLQESLPETQTKLNQALSKQDLKGLKDELHKLLGACCYTGVPRLKELTKELNSWLASGFEKKWDSEKLHSKMKQLNDCMRQLCEENMEENMLVQ